jgi:hypothetical protein
MRTYLLLGYRRRLGLALLGFVLGLFVWEIVVELPCARGLSAQRPAPGYRSATCGRTHSGKDVGAALRRDSDRLLVIVVVLVVADRDIDAGLRCRSGCGWSGELLLSEPLLALVEPLGHVCDRKVQGSKGRR